MLGGDELGPGSALGGSQGKGLVWGGSGALLGALGILSPHIVTVAMRGDAVGRESRSFVGGCGVCTVQPPLCSPINRVVADTTHVAAQSRCSQYCSASSPLKA